MNEQSKTGLRLQALDAISAFWSWWTDELTSVVDECKSFFNRRRDATLAIVRDDAGFLLLPSATPGASLLLATTSGRLDDEESARLRKTLKSQRLSRTAVRIDQRDCFTMSTRIPKAALRKLAAVIDAEIQCSTPFRNDRYVWGSRIYEQFTDSVVVETIVVERNMVTPLNDALRMVVNAAPPTLQTYEKDTGGVIEYPIGHIETDLAPARMHPFTLGALALAVGACLTSSALVLVAQVDARAELALNLSRARQDVQREAKTRRSARAALDTIFTVEAEKLKTPLLSDIWEEAAKLLPDGTWLIGLRKNGDNAVLTGFADNAPALIDVLGSSGIFMEPSFGAPVVADERARKQRFEIVVRLRPMTISSPATR